MSVNWARFWAWFAVGVMVVGLLVITASGIMEALKVLW